jgi:hypothetical protein
MYEKSLEPELTSKARERFNRLLSGKHSHITKEKVDGLIPGSIDLHIHAWPDAYVARQHSEIEIGRRATDAGMRAVVFKCHCGMSRSTNGHRCRTIASSTCPKSSVS